MNFNAAHALPDRARCRTARRTRPPLVVFGAAALEFRLAAAATIADPACKALPGLLRRGTAHHAPGPVARMHARSRPGVEVLVAHTRCDARGFHDDQLPIVGGLLAQFMRERGIVEPLVWLDTPAPLPLAEALNPRGLVYDCHDDAAASSGRRHPAPPRGAPDATRRRRGGRRPVAVPVASRPPCQRALHRQRGRRGALRAAADRGQVDRGGVGARDPRGDPQPAPGLLRRDRRARRPRPRRPHGRPAPRLALRDGRPAARRRARGAAPARQPRCGSARRPTRSCRTCRRTGTCACCRSRSTPARTARRRSRRWSTWPGRSRWSARRCTTSSRCTATSCAPATTRNSFVEACRAAMCERGPLRRQRRIDALIAVHSCTWDRAADRVHKLLVEFAHEPAASPARCPRRRLLAVAPARLAAHRRALRGRLSAAGMPDAVRRAGRDRGAALNIQEESAMNRSISLSLTLAVALASQVALGGCSKKEDVSTTSADTLVQRRQRARHRAPPARWAPRRRRWTASAAPAPWPAPTPRARSMRPPATPRSPPAASRAAQKKGRLRGGLFRGAATVIAAWA